MQSHEFQPTNHLSILQLVISNIISVSLKHDILLATQVCVVSYLPGGFKTDTCWRHLVWDCVEATNPSYACLGSPSPSFLPLLALDASPFGGYVFIHDWIPSWIMIRWLWLWRLFDLKSVVCCILARKQRLQILTMDHFSEIIAISKFLTWFLQPFWIQHHGPWASSFMGAWRSSSSVLDNKMHALVGFCCRQRNVTFSCWMFECLIIIIQFLSPAQDGLKHSMHLFSLLFQMGPLQIWRCCGGCVVSFPQTVYWWTTYVTCVPVSKTTFFECLNDLKERPDWTCMNECEKHWIGLGRR